MMMFVTPELHVGVKFRMVFSTTFRDAEGFSPGFIQPLIHNRNYPALKGTAS